METWPSGKAMRPAFRMVAIDKLKVGERETSAEVQHDRAFPPKNLCNGDDRRHGSGGGDVAWYIEGASPRVA